MTAVLAASSSPGLIAQVPSVDLNSLSGTGLDALNRSRGWVPVLGGKAEVRFKGMDAKGQTLCEARGAKSTVPIRANSFAEAEKQTAKLVSNKALTPRDPAATGKLTKPKLMPGGRSRSGGARSNTQKPIAAANAGSGGGAPRVNPSAGNSKAPIPSSSPITTAGKPVAGVSAGQKTSATTAADTEKKREGINPRSASIYAVTGAVASYNVNRSTGMSSSKALALIPAGFGRDVVQVAISQVPIEVKNPYLEIAIKGATGGVLTYGSNSLAAKFDSRAKPSAPIHGGMVAAAFNVNGSIIGLRELQKKGYMGGVPADNPADWKQWSHKYGLESAAIGVGVGTAITPAVVFEQAMKKAAGQGFSKSTVLKTLILSTGLPMLQNALSRAATSPPDVNASGVRKNEYKPRETATDVGTYMAGDAIAKKVLNQPMTKGGTLKSAGWAVYFSVLGEGLKIIGTRHTLQNHNVESLKKNINTARDALTDIHTLRTHPANGMIGAFAPGGNAGFNKTLMQFQDAIYRMHPSLRPETPVPRNYNPGGA